MNLEPTSKKGHFTTEPSEIMGKALRVVVVGMLSYFVSVQFSPWAPMLEHTP